MTIGWQRPAGAPVVRWLGEQLLIARERGANLLHATNSRPLGLAAAAPHATRARSRAETLTVMRGRAIRFQWWCVCRPSHQIAAA